MFDSENAIALHAVQEIWATCGSRGRSHGFSRVAAGTWIIFSSNGGDVLSKMEFLHRSQDTCLGMTDTSGM